MGPVVLYVQPGSPADQVQLRGARQKARRGLYVGYFFDFEKADFILAVNGEKVTSKSDVINAIGKTKPNDKVRLLLRRGLGSARPRTVSVTPELS